MERSVDAGIAGFEPKIYQPRIENYHLKMLIYGPPGVGKTWLAASANDCEWMQPALLLNVEAGTLATVERSSPTVDFEGFEALNKLFWWLATAKHGYKTFIIDTLTELQAKNLEVIVESEVRKKTNPKRTDIDDIWHDDYAKSTQALQRICRAFRDLSMHVIFICHETLVGEGNNVTVEPLLTPRLRNSIIAYCDVVGYLYTILNEEGAQSKPNIVRRLLVQSHPRYRTKDRSPGQKLGGVIESPTMNEVARRLMAKEVGK